MSKMIEFEVTGTGQFPVDMLRYDSCWPARQVDVAEMKGTYSKRTVRLQGVPVNLTPARWKSFGWTLTKI